MSKNKRKALLILFIISPLCSADENNDMRVTSADYCECTFYDHANTKQTLFISWADSQEVFIRIDDKPYPNFKKTLEDLRIPINAPGRFVFTHDKDIIEGHIKTISNCIDSLSGNCEHIGMTGTASVTLEGKRNDYKIEGGCGC